jgi:outer membrane receptor protein involved in Fe transport
MPGIRVNSSRVFGKVLDKNSGRNIEAASAQLYRKLPDGRDSLISGMLSRANGDFSFTDLPADSSLKIVITAIGYENFEQSINLSSGSADRDLGNIILAPAIQQLGNVTVTAARPGLQMGIDRKVFNVANSLTATGGTAIDVMKNIPTVTVDIEGNVQLRNAAPQIFVDGQPTILTLDQIPADNIERVELITNPSAKFDASSSAGIINVVLKKNKRIGLNGIVTAAGGTPKIASGNLNLNLREGKFNFFLTGGYNQSGGKAEGRTLRENKSNGVTQDFFNQYTFNDRMRRFGSARFGFDIFLDNRNTLTLSQGYVTGRFTNSEEQDQVYLNADRELEYYGERFADARSKFKRNTSRLSYKHSFPEQGKEIIADINYNYGNNSENSDIINSFFFPNGTEYEPPATVRNEGRSSNDQLTFQIDYADPIGEEAKLELGARSYHNKFVSFYNAFAVDNGSEVKLPLSNNYEYSEMVNAVYGTYSAKVKTISYQVGLRAEHSKFEGTLIDSALKFGYEYPAQIRNIWDALFPSASISKELNENSEMQLNYSRRIRRPGFWQLNPFIDINDPANLRQGNPNLRPEFINSFEFNYNLKYNKGNFLGSIYFRNNPNDITQYSDTITAEQFQQLENAAVDPNAILNTFINANTTNRYGIELTLQQTLARNFDITPSFDLQYRTVNARVNDQDLSNEGISWEAKLVANYKMAATSGLFKSLSFQTIGEYESSEVIPQGRRSPQYSVDLAMRKDFLKDNKATLTFGVNDVFNTHRFGTIYDTENFYQDSYRRRNVRSFRVTFSYKFGSADFSLMNRRQENNNDD